VRIVKGTVVEAAPEEAPEAAPDPAAEEQA